MLITLFKNLLLPPAFQFLMIFLGLILWHRWRFIARSLVFLALSSLFLLSLPMVASALFIWLEKPFIQPINHQIKQAEAVIVLGAGRIREATTAGEDVLSGSALGRLTYGVRLAMEYQIPLVVSGGTVFSSESVSEADLARRTMAELGSPINIIAEGNSRNTWQNAQNTAELLKQRDIQSVILVTDGYHMRRSMMSFTHFGVDAIPMPTGLRSRNLTHTISDWIPSASAVSNARTALHEYIGLIFYSLR